MTIELDEMKIESLAADVASDLKKRLSELMADAAKEEGIDSADTPKTEGAAVINNEKKSLTVGFWNVGHWAMGKSHQTAIATDKDGKKAAEYRKAIAEIGGGTMPDIFGTAEFSDNFTKDGVKADEAVFGEYRYKTKGKQYGFTHNNIFANLPLLDSGEIKLDAPLGEPYRTYQWALIEFGGKEVLVVSTHVAHWATTTIKGNDKEQVHQKIRKPQFEQLAKLIRENERVIMMADWNTAPDSIYCPKYTYGETTKYGYGWGAPEAKIDKYEHEPWLDLGLEYAFGRETRHGHLNKSHVDNILVKGLDIVSVRDLDSGLSDHVIIGVTVAIIDNRR